MFIHYGVEFRLNFLVDYPATTDSKQQNLIHAFGPGLQQAQVGVPTSFTVDGHRAVDSTEDIKVLVTSKINSCKKNLSFSAV